MLQCVNLITYTAAQIFFKEMQMERTSYTSKIVVEAIWVCTPMAEIAPNTLPPKYSFMSLVVGTGCLEFDPHTPTGKENLK